MVWGSMESSGEGKLKSINGTMDPASIKALYFCWLMVGIWFLGWLDVRIRK